jgi:hypothetical protein
MDGLRLLSVIGEMEVDGEEYSDKGVTIRLGDWWTEARSTPFSAASRDPVFGRFQTIEDYFWLGHEEQYPCCLCVRATIRDLETGAMAVIHEEGKAIARKMVDTGAKGSFEVLPAHQRHGAEFVISEVPEESGKKVDPKDRLYEINQYDPQDFELVFPPECDYQTIRLGMSSWLYISGQAMRAGEVTK